MTGGGNGPRRWLGTAWMWHRDGSIRHKVASMLLDSPAGWDAMGWMWLAWLVRLRHGPFGFMKGR